MADRGEQGNMSDDPTFTHLDECVEYWRNHWRVPGMAVATLRDGQIESRSYGITSIGTGHAVTPDTLFQIGSISKLYTSTLAMILVDEGRLDLDEPVTTYLPNFTLKDKEALKVISLRHLLSHTSGVFGDFFDDFGMGDDALERYVEAMAELRQIYAPNELWSYTNSGFNLAGRMIEKVMDKPFEDVMRYKLIEPAGLENTVQFAHEAITYPVAVGHTHPDPDDEGNLEIARKYPLPRTSQAAGGIIATAEDVLKFARMHLDFGVANGNRILSESTVKEMQTTQTKAANMADEWGLGWMIFDLSGTKGIGHGGTTNGFQAVMRAVPESNFAIAILTNSDRGHAAERPILKWAFQHYLNISLPEHQEITVEPEELDRFVGKYSQQWAEIVVSNPDGTLRMDVHQKSALSDTEEGKKLPTVAIKPIDDTVFVVTEGPMSGHTLDFVEKENGEIRFIRVGGRFADRVTS